MAKKPVKKVEEVKVEQKVKRDGLAQSMNENKSLSLHAMKLMNARNQRQALLSKIAKKSKKSI